MYILTIEEIQLRKKTFKVNILVYKHKGTFYKWFTHEPVKGFFTVNRIH